MKYERPSLDDVYLLCQQLADRIRAELGKELDNAVLLAVSRGGLVPARILADLLGKREIQCISARSYTGIGKHGKKVRVSQFPSARVKGRTVLVVDDIADSGHTLALVRKLLEAKGAAVVTATLHYKPRSVSVPDFFASKKQDSTWIIYPWERNEFREQKEKEIKP